jgi:hypothetical protein
MTDPQLVGCYDDDDGVARCRASGKRCLSRRQAVEKARAATRKARERNDGPITEYHCTSCDCWHYGHPPRRVEKPSRPRRPRRPRTPRRRGW